MVSMTQGWGGHLPLFHNHEPVKDNKNRASPNRPQPHVFQKYYLILRFNPGLGFINLRPPGPPGPPSYIMAHHHFDSRSHSTLLSASLQNLQLSTDSNNIPDQDVGATDYDTINETRPNITEEIIDSPKATGSSKPLIPPSSGLSTPYTAISATGIESPIPDPNGLGWPGECWRLCENRENSFVLIQRCSSKIYSPSIECLPCREARTGTTARRRSSHNPRMFGGGSGPRRPPKDSRTLRKSSHVDDSRL